MSALKIVTLLLGLGYNRNYVKRYVFRIANGT